MYFDIEYYYCKNKVSTISYKKYVCNKSKNWCTKRNNENIDIYEKGKEVKHRNRT